MSDKGGLRIKSLKGIDEICSHTSQCQWDDGKWDCIVDVIVMWAVYVIKVGGESWLDATINGMICSGNGINKYFHTDRISGSTLWSVFFVISSDLRRGHPKKTLFGKNIWTSPGRFFANKSLFFINLICSIATSKGDTFLQLRIFHKPNPNKLCQKMSEINFLKIFLCVKNYKIIAAFIRSKHFMKWG